MRTIFRRRGPNAVPATDPRLLSACYAPHSALYLAPDGMVNACCTTGFSVGSVTGPARQSLREIWEGASLAEQRAALEAGRFDFGCQECELAEATGGRQAALSYHFDRFADDAPHPFPRLMDFALSSRCNLQCVMCNGGLSSSIRAKRDKLPPLPGAYDDRFFDELEEFLPHLQRAQFKGGEPFLAQENRRIWDRLIDQRLTPEVTLTTNATIFNDNVERYVSELQIHPIISVDGMAPETLESIRVGVVAEKLWTNIDHFQRVVESFGRSMTLSFCLMTVNWREALPFLVETERRGVGCNIIFVNQPGRFDLLQLPHHELVEIHQELAALPTAFRTPEPDRAWRELLGRVSSQVGSPVELVVRSPPPVRLDPAQQVRLRSSLVEAHGIVPLALEVEDDSIAEVDAPAWATWLKHGDWIGRSLEALEPLIDREVGALSVQSMEPEVPGVDLIALLIDTAEGRRALRVHLFFDEATGHQRAFLVEVDPTGAPATPTPQSS